MKKHLTITIVSVFLLCLPAAAHASVAVGRSLLFNNGNPTMTGIVAAKKQFETAVQVNADDQEANFFLAMTRLLALVDNDASYTAGLPIENIKELLDGMGISEAGRDFFDWTANFKKDENGNIIMPTGAPSIPDIQEFLLGVILTEIDQAIDHLAVVQNAFNLTINASETGEDHDVEVDYGDVLLFRSLLYAAKSAIWMLTSYHGDVDLHLIAKKVSNGIFHLQDDLLDLYPDLGTLLLEGKDRMEKTRSLFLVAIDNYLDASDFIRNETDAQWDDLLAMDEEELEEEAHFKSQLLEIKDSLIQEKVAVLDFENNIEVVTDYVDFNPLFGSSTKNPLNVRDILPVFDRRGNIHTGTFPDVTMKGILVDRTTEADLLKFLPVPISVVFPIVISTAVMDGKENDWAGVPKITPEYFSSRRMNQDIEYVKIAKDDNYLYWMIKFYNAVRPETQYAFSINSDTESGWISVNAGIAPDLSYRISAWRSGYNHNGTAGDFGIDEIVEGRIPLWMTTDLEGALGMGISAYNWNVYYYQYLSDSNILTTTPAPMAKTDNDQIVYGSITLNGKLVYPGKTIVSWEWSLEHRANSSFNRSANGENPTINDLAPGFYDVILTVTDDNGQGSVDKMLLAVTGTNGYYTEAQMEAAVRSERQKWDADNDNSIGLEEAIRALQVTSGIRSD